MLGITTTYEKLPPEDVQYARHLATTNLKTIEDSEKIGRTAFLKKHLPELAQYAQVVFNPEENYWLVKLASLRFSWWRKALPLPEHVGCCPVYHMQAPVVTTDSEMNVTRPSDGWNLNCGFPNMTPAEFLADKADLCGLVQAAFPESIGLRLHPWHYIDVLYSSEKALDKDANLIFQPHMFRNYVCYMQYDLKVWDDEVKLPGTTVVRFDPEKRIPLLLWMTKGKYNRDWDEKASKNVEGDSQLR